MKKRSNAYRIFSLLMAVLVAVSISLPSALLAAHCEMNDQQSPKSEMIGEHCPHMKVDSSQQKHAHQNDDCNWTLSCACDIDQQRIIAEAVPTITKTAKAFVVSVTRFIDLVPTDTPIFFTNFKFSSHAEFPPLFLLNSVFLN